MTITVPVANTALSVAGFGKPVADQINAWIPTAWTNIPLNGFTVGAGQTPMYRRIGDIVYLKGNLAAASSGNGASGNVGATLPSGYRPLQVVEFAVFCYNNGWTSCNITVDTTGGIKYVNPPSISTVPNNISLWSVFFPTS